jgi:hypothetical protein
MSAHLGVSKGGGLTLIRAGGRETGDADHRPIFRLHHRTLAGTIVKVRILVFSTPSEIGMSRLLVACG